VLGEHLFWYKLVGGALVLGGAALANQAPAEPAPESA
jgi:drug/metabolite transporter (DMT)-like permease